MGITHRAFLHIMCFIASEGLLFGIPDDAVIRYVYGLAVDAQRHLEITIGTRHLTLVLADRSIVYNQELRLRRAFFDYRCILDGRYVGVLHLNNGVFGTMRLDGKEYVIRDKSADTRYLNDLAFPEKDKRHTVKIRVLLINDTNRVARLESRVFDETLNIFRNASRIFEREDWGGYKISLKLSNIFSVEKGPVAFQTRGIKHLGLRVPSDSVEEDYESRREDTLSAELGTVQDVSGPRRRYQKDLASMADMLERVLANSKREDEFHEQQDVVFVISDETNKDIEGLSYDGCAFGQDMCLGIVFIGGCNDSHFHGRVLAHELVHILGGPHDIENGFLMEAASGEHTKRMDVGVSKATKLAVTQFLRSRGRVPA